MFIKKFFLRNWSWPNGIAVAHRQLANGLHRHDVLEQAVMAVENDPDIRSVAYGGAPNLLGVPQFDAGFMDGNTRELGTIAAAEGYPNPVRLARRLMETGLHTMLAGAEGIALFAHGQGFEKGNTLSPQAQKDWEEKAKPLLHKIGKDGITALDVVREISAPLKKTPHHDTCVMAVSDSHGISVATSTAGWDYKHPGRVGDSPICGAGFYVDSRYGACLCTHTGEVSTRAGTARSVVEAMALGKTLHDAVEYAIDDIGALHGGRLGGLVIHALDKGGEARIVALNAKDGREPICCQYWREGMDAPKVLEAEYRELVNLKRGRG